MTFRTIMAVLLPVFILGLGGYSSASMAQPDYGDYDFDEDGNLGEDEWIDYSYDTIDYDGNDVIDIIEWNNYLVSWYEPYDLAREGDLFSSYDANQDGFIDGTEYEDAYDPDIFGAWDNNDDGVISVGEYDTVLQTYKEAGESAIFFDW